MDRTISFYQHCVKKLLARYELSSPAWTKTELIFDDARMSYIVLRVGWFKEQRVHRCLVHIDIYEQPALKIVIQANNTEDLVKTELVEMGIPDDVICLGFIPAEEWALVQPVTPEAQLEPA